MNNKRFLVSILCALTMMLGIAGFGACGQVVVSPPISSSSEVSLPESESSRSEIESSDEESKDVESNDKDEDSSASCVHEWVDAGCVTPKTCKACGATEGDALGHAWVNADCDTPKTCKTCGTTEGDALGHNWVNADCDTPKTCKTCGTTEGDALGHNWVNADCDTPKTCKTCGTTEGDALGHNWADADCDTPKTCKTCGDTEGSALGHDWADADCDTPKTCKTCGDTEGAVRPHAWSDWVSDGNGNHVRTCTYDCGAKESEYCYGGTATLTERAVCTVCGGEYGGYDVCEHNFVEVAEAVYVATDATCETAATYYKSCEYCHEINDETFSYGEALGHDMTNWTSTGNNQHTRRCVNDDCEEVETVDCYGGTASCTDKATCEVCGEKYGAEPAHAWDNGVETPATCVEAGKMTYTCGSCGETKEETIAASGHSYDSEVTDPTCTAQGYTTYTCACGDSYIDKNSYVAAAGHAWDKDEVTCEEGRACATCGAEEAARGHDYKVTASTEATCVAAATETYTCGNCDDFYTEDVRPALGHKQGELLREDHVDGCVYVQIYDCVNCDKDVEGDQVERHTLTASITTPATCQTDGVKTLSCEDCTHTEEAIIVKSAEYHVWPTEGVLSGNIRTFTCTVEGCSETKTTIDASAETSANVSKEDLANNELQLKDAAIKMDNDTLEGLGENLTLSVGTLDTTAREEATSNLTDDQKAQLGNNPIYNFEAEADNKAVTNFDGFITITLPYTLEEGENVDNIAVWYIDNEGNLQNISATYITDEAGNGFVTFQTNHFSYYTVTRLTPAERCALYGHQYRDSVVKATCTKDGYELHVCIRCAYSYKDKEEAKKGHTYTETITPATCTTAGKSVKICACGHKLETRIKALGHSWAVTDSQDASCQAAGYTIHGCQNEGCSASYTERFAILAHTYEESVVDVTCETNGYTLHDCVNCDYSYTDAIVFALGHNYQATNWEWSEEKADGSYDWAKLTFVCGNCQDTFVLDASINKEETNSSCERQGKITNTATVTYNGQTYTDVREKVKESVGHTYADGLKSNKHTHWHQCRDCKGKVNEEPHTKVFVRYIKRPTCEKKGQALYECTVCGYSIKENVEATGEHLYENGVCVDCGERYKGCDHSKLYDIVVDFSEYGCCEGTVSYQSCECGAVKVYDLDVFNFRCDIETISEEEGVMDDGTLYQRMVGQCSICGMTIYGYFEGVQNGCMMTVTMTYSFEKDGVMIIENATVTETYEEHNDQYVNIDLSTVGACGGTLRGYMCEGCGVITYMEFFEPSCNVSEDNMIYEESDNYIKAMVTCPDCGFTYIMEMSRTVEGCTEIQTQTLYIYNVAQELLYYYEDTSRYTEHQWEETYVMLGDTCEDGVEIIRTCTVCGDYSTEIYYGHNTRVESINLSDYGACGGYIDYSACSYCRQITYLWVNAYCDYEVTESYYTDENGIEHCVYSYICKNHYYEEELDSSSYPDDYASDEWSSDYARYGLTYSSAYASAFDSIYYNSDFYASTYDSVSADYERPETESRYGCGAEWSVDSYTMVDGCKTYDYAIFSYKIGDTVLFDRALYVRGTYVEHDFVYTYEFANPDAPNCEDGVTITANCSVCGETKTYTQSYHEMIDIIYDYTDYGMCGGRFAYAACPCGIRGELYEYAPDCGYEIEQNSFVDENGVSHKTVTLFSESCDWRILADEYVVVDGCYSSTYYAYTLIINGETIVELNFLAYRNENHKYLYSFEMNGESCEDGVNVTTTCENCDYVSTRYITYHQAFETYQYLADNGACDGYIRVAECPCGQEYSAEWSIDCISHVDTTVTTDDNGVEHTIDTYRCDICNTVVICDTYSIMENCMLKTYSTNNITVGDNVIVSNYTRFNDQQYAHDFIVSYTEKDGSYTVTTRCSVCGIGYPIVTDDGEMLSAELENHDGQYYYDYTFVPEVSDYYIIESYGTGDTYVELYVSYGSDKMERIAYDDDGGEGNQFLLFYYLEAGVTYVYRIRFLDGVSSGTIPFTLVQGEKPGNTCSHYNGWLTYTVCLVEGGSCEDGTLYAEYCCACGYVRNAYVRYSHSTSRKYVELSQYDVCGGYIQYYACDCGYISSFNYNLYCNYTSETTNPVDENGVEHTLYTRTCATCGLVLVEDRYTLVEGCYRNTYRAYTVTINGETIFDATYRYGYDTIHEYVYSFEFANPDAPNCADGVTVTTTCANCDYVTTNYYNDHNAFEYNYDLTEYGACGGWVTWYKCPCEQAGTIHWSIDCISSNVIENPTYTDDNGIVHTVETGVCADCGITMVVDRFSIYEGCWREDYITYSISVGENVLISNYTYLYDQTYEHNFIVSYTETDDGYALSTCCDQCGAGYAQEGAQIITVELEYHDGQYYYDYTFTPDETASYTVKGLADSDTYVHLFEMVDGEMVQIDYNDDGYGNQFYLTTTLTAGVTYVYRIRFYSAGNSGTIAFELSKASAAVGECYHGNYGWESFSVCLVEGGNCEDGVISGSICCECGYVRSVNIRYSHYDIGWYYESLSDYGACGGEIEYNACTACGEVSNVSYYISCNSTSETTYPVDENGVEHTLYTRTCATCGLVLVEDRYTLVEGCYRNSYRAYTVTINGETIFDAAYIYSTYTTHEYAYAYEFANPDDPICTNGVTVTATCVHCDYVYTEYYNYHAGLLDEHYVLSDYGACRGTVTTYVCPCGAEKSLNTYDLCYDRHESTKYVGDDGLVHTVHTYTCTTCALYRTEETYNFVEDCQRKYCAIINVSIGDTVIVSDYNYCYDTETAHSYVYTYEFTNPDEPNCADGVTVYVTCENCDYENSYTRSYHSRITHRYNFADYGACGGYFNYEACPCGYSVSFSQSMSSCNYTSETTYYDDAYGVQHTVYTRACKDCTLVVQYDQYTLLEGCYRNTYRVYSATINGETIVSDLEYCYNSNTEHVYAYTYEFANPDAPNCEDGVKVIASCTNCDYTYERNHTSHNTYRQEYYNFTDYGACSGSYSYYVCPCGEVESHDFSNHGTSNSSTTVDDNGVKHYVTVYDCATCGYRYQNSYYIERNSTTCEETQYHTLMISVGAEMLVYKTYETSSIVHKYVTTGVLDEGATTCYEGVTLTYNCSDCGDSYSNHYTWHYEYVVQRISTEEHGNVCGGDIKIYGCTCGDYINVQLGELQCDTGRSYIDCWVEDYIHGYHYTTQGEKHFSDSTYRYTCAVTDPQCAFTFRYSTYWLKEADACLARQHFTLQVYHADTDTWEDVAHIERPYTSTYHAYVTEELSETYDDGSYMNGTKYTCDCGSYYQMTSVRYPNSKDVTNEQYAYNTLSNGENLSWYALDVYKYDMNGGENYYRKSYSKYVAADGTESWAQYEYTEDRDYVAPYGDGDYEYTREETNSSGYYYKHQYAYTYITINDQRYYYLVYSFDQRNDSWARYDNTYNFDNGCVRTVVYTSNIFDNNTYTESAHHTSWKWIEYPTCTQNGTEGEVCRICETVTYTSTRSPYNHDWRYIEENHYYCTRCGLENANGASGDVIFEDFTGEYGNGENYVAGYYSSSNVRFTYYVSLILHEPMENGDDEVVLADYVNFMEVEGLRAIAISISEVETMATALGYTADQYDVRLAFVPIGMDGSLDYAITFTDKADIVGTITEAISFVDYVGIGETNRYTIIPTERLLWTFTSSATSGTYAYLYDAEDNCMTYNDNSGGNSQFRMYAVLEAGQTYYFDVKWDSSSRHGYVPVFLTTQTIDDVLTDAIVGDTTFVATVGAGESIRYTIAPTVTARWTFTSDSNYDSYAYLYDVNGNQITYNDDHYTNQFYISYTLQAGQIYYFEVRWYHTSTTGEMPIIITTSVA